LLLPQDIAKDASMVQWFTNLASVFVGAVIGVALEPAKAFLLARWRTKRMRSILYEELASYYRKLQSMEKEPSTYDVAEWLEDADFPMCHHFIKKDLELFYRVPDALGINGIRQYFELTRKNLAAGKIRETETIKDLLMVFEIWIAHGRLDRGMLEMWAAKQEIRGWNSALGVRKLVHDVDEQKRSYDA
jgi:hypothetical protein